MECPSSLCEWIRGEGLACQLEFGPYVVGRTVVVVGEALEELPWFAVRAVGCGERPSLGEVGSSSLADAVEVGEQEAGGW
jgi:hypothetical protein